MRKLLLVAAVVVVVLGFGLMAMVGSLQPGESASVAQGAASTESKAPAKKEQTQADRAQERFLEAARKQGGPDLILAQQTVQLRKSGQPWFVLDEVMKEASFGMQMAYQQWKRDSR